jgi:hypothetical protein
MFLKLATSVGASGFWNNLWKGWLGSTAKNNLDRRNLTSLKAVWDDSKWIGGV